MHKLLTIFLGLTLLAATFSCGKDAPPQGASIAKRDSAAVMLTWGCSKMISDSGVMRYKVIAEKWEVFDRTTPTRHAFEKGIFLERFDDQFKVDLHITADTAYWYDQNLWELRGRVVVDNLKEQTLFKTELLWWNTGSHEFYSKAYMNIFTPDRHLEGYDFHSNESMTRYSINQPKGYMPVPKDAGPTAESTDESTDETTPN